MKKSFAELLSQKQKRKREQPTSQKPWNEKPIYSSDSLEKAQMKGRSAEEILKHHLRDTFGKTVLSQYARSQYAPGEKPW